MNVAIFLKMRNEIFLPKLMQPIFEWCTCVLLKCCFSMLVFFGSDTVNWESFVSAKCRISNFRVQTFSDACRPSVSLTTTTYWYRWRNYKKNHVFIVENFEFILSIIRYQQAIRKYLNTEIFLYLVLLLWIKLPSCTDPKCIYILYFVCCFSIDPVLSLKLEKQNGRKS